MRIWSLHPRYLDPQGLVALWRETLLAQKVLRGETRGYRHHPQLLRFQNSPKPVGLVNRYLLGVWEEANARGYHFDRSKVGPVAKGLLLPVTHGQLDYEWEHLTAKLARRSAAWGVQWSKVKQPQLHPLFKRVAGGVEEWERV